jgi:hypothetical protein
MSELMTRPFAFLSIEAGAVEVKKKKVADRVDENVRRKNSSPTDVIVTLTNLEWSLGAAGLPHGAEPRCVVKSLIVLALKPCHCFQKSEEQ